MVNQIDLIKKQIKENIQFLIDDNKLNEAMDLIDKYFEISINDVEMYSIKAVIFIMQGNISEAEEVLKQGLTIDEENFDLNYNLGYIYEQKEKLEEAVKHYKKALENCHDENITTDINNIVEKILSEHKSFQVKTKKKLAFFVKMGMDSFLGDIINKLSDEYEIKKVVVTDYKQIDEWIHWSDICWFEWCDEIIIYASKLNFTKKKRIICRLHSYEAFTDYPSKVNWENVDKLIFVAEHIKKVVLDKVKIKEEKIAIIPNGIDVSKYSFKERNLGFNVAYVGYINYKKGPMLLLHTFKALYDKDKRYKFYIAGQFQDERDVLYFNQMIKEFGIEKNVFYEGWQDNLDEWLEDKNYILCTSVLESQNMSVMQAMAKGIKPIVHNFVGAKTIYNEKYVWNTIDEAVKNITSRDYNSREYREFVQKNYCDKVKHKEIMNVINCCTGVLEEPLVTIGVVNYNYGKFIEECLYSILNQNYKSLEVIVIDDCSTDNSREIIDSYKEQYKGLIRTIYHEKNSGSGMKGFQETIAEANGEYFMIVSADDCLVGEDVIKEFVDEFIKNDSFDFVYGDLVIVDKNTKVQQKWTYRQLELNEIVLETYNRSGSGVIPVTCGIYKTAFYRKDNRNWEHNPDNIVASDTLNAMVNTKYGWNIKYLNKDIIKYRQHDNNTTYDLKNRIKSMITIIEYILNNFNETTYLPNINWISLKGNKKLEIKAFLAGKKYYEILLQYYNNDFKPWGIDGKTFSREEIKEFVQPILDKIYFYFNKCIILGNSYSKDINSIRREIEGIYIKNNKNMKSKICINDEIYITGKQRRADLLLRYNNKYKNKNLKILIFSPQSGAVKFMYNSWKEILSYTGIEADIVEDIDIEKDYSTYNVFISVASPYFIEKIMKNNTIFNIRYRFGGFNKQISLINNSYSNSILDNKLGEEDLATIELLKKNKVFTSLYTSFDNKELVNYIGSSWIDMGLNIFYVPFGFNPLIHYPENYIKEYDYFFIGTNSYLKSEETRKYLVPIVNKFRGVLAGQGFGENISMITDQNIIRNTYSKAKININYHLGVQKKYKYEVNERTFIISACGGFQLIDNPKILNKYYNNKDMAIARDEKEYVEMFEYYLNKPDIRNEMAYSAMVKTYDNNYSLFSSIDKLMNMIEVD